MGRGGRCAEGGGKRCLDPPACEQILTRQAALWEKQKPEEEEEEEEEEKNSFSPNV